MLVLYRVNNLAKETEMSEKSENEDFEWDEFDQMEFAAEFEMALDIFEFALEEKREGLPNTDSDSLLERFKKSDYESAKRLCWMDLP